MFGKACQFWYARAISDCGTKTEIVSSLLFSVTPGATNNHNYSQNNPPKQEPDPPPPKKKKKESIIIWISCHHVKSFCTVDLNKRRLYNFGVESRFKEKNLSIEADYPSFHNHLPHTPPPPHTHTHVWDCAWKIVDMSSAWTQCPTWGSTAMKLSL